MRRPLASAVVAGTPRPTWCVADSSCSSGFFQEVGKRPEANPDTSQVRAESSSLSEVSDARFPSVSVAFSRLPPES